MREFKFRAWDKNLKKMYYKLCVITVLANHPDENYVIMQYTGLKDKNGKEIYDGDVVSIRNWGLRNKEIIGNAVVEWDVDEVGWRYQPNYGIEDIYDMFRNVEVIGNCYENPELFEVQINT